MTIHGCCAVWLLGLLGCADSKPAQQAQVVQDEQPITNARGTESPEPDPSTAAVADQYDGPPSNQPSTVTPVLPQMAVRVALSYLTPSARYNAMYDEFIAGTVKQALPRREVIQRLQDNYFPLVRLLNEVAQERPRDVVFRHHRKDRRSAFWLRKHARTQGQLWGVGFRWERGGWRLEQTRPDIFALQGDAESDAP